MSKCASCSLVISVTDKIGCLDCTKTYHYTCVGMDKDEYKKLSARAKKAWKCADCTKPEAPETPLKSPSSGTPSVGVDVMEKQWSLMESSIVAKLTTIFESTFVANLKSDVTKLRQDVVSLLELKTSVEHMSEIHDETLRELKALRKEAQDLRVENRHLSQEVSELSFKVDQMEQHSRDCNLEIQCLPEFKNENLVMTVKNLATIVSCPLTDQEILSCSRVAKLNPSSPRPRSVIVRLPSPRKRDEILVACAKYNKSRKSDNDKLDSSILGIGGDKKRIYVAEHLTKKNRDLHASARKFKNENKYAYVWVRNGRVLIRQDEKSPAIWVKNLDVLKNLSK